MKNVKKNILSLSVIIWLVVLTGFQGVPTKQQLIQEELARKLEEFRSKQALKCQEKVLERAAEVVDSILVERARQTPGEIIIKPSIPPRPERPEVMEPKDTTPVKPILPDDNGME